jgi:pimeloyl-ACP methyl ester carboxylesterase
VAPGPSTPRGESLDVGGRRLRVVRAGPAGATPLVLLVHGSFGCAADWAVVQEKLAAQGLRSLAYDRPGLGHSDPGPSPRDGHAMVADIEALLRATGETGPLALAGHSMAGLVLRQFAVAHPTRVLGIVLVDPVMPEVMTELPGGPRGVWAYGLALRLASWGAKLGLMRLLAPFTGDLIGLPPQASAEKRRIYGLAGHAHWSAEEVAHWPAASDQAAAGDYPGDFPIAVITAGETLGRRLKAIQAAPALASRHGHVEHVAGANHSSLLGPRYADAIVRGVVHVLKAAG